MPDGMSEISNSELSRQLEKLSDQVRSISDAQIKMGSAQLHMMEEAKADRHDMRDKMNEFALGMKTHEVKDEQRFAQAASELDSRFTIVETILQGDGERPGLLAWKASQQEFTSFAKRVLVTIACGVGATFATLLFAVLKDYLIRTGGGP